MQISLVRTVTILALAATAAVGVRAHAQGTGQVVQWGYVVGEIGPRPLLRYLQVAAGGEHTLALRADGTVAAWGYQSFGQTSVPTNLVGVVHIAAGLYHSLAITSTGEVVAWGAGEPGTTGWEDRGQSTVPPGLSGCIQAAAGSFHSVVCQRNGTVQAWGDNEYGQSDCPKLHGAVQVAAGQQFSIARLSDGGLVPWGSATIPSGIGPASEVAATDLGIGVIKPDGAIATWNSDGSELGPPPSGQFRQLAGGLAGNFVALKHDGTVIQWPNNTHGRSGIPPVVTGVTQVTVGAYHSAALLGDGNIACWDYNQWGQANPPADLSNIRDIDCAGDLSVALRDDGSVLAWGYESDTYGHTSFPTGLTGVLQAEAGGEHGLALLQSGRVIGWGRNLEGQCLGSDATGQPITGLPLAQPVRVQGVTLESVRRVSAGEAHSIALKADGSVVGWGSNLYGQASPPQPVESVEQIAAGGRHNLALTASGLVIAWGANPDGRCLGTNSDGSPITTLPQGQPTRIMGRVLSMVRQVAAGDSHSIALRTDGSVVAWGSNDNGQTTVPSSVGTASHIAAGARHSVAILADGTVVGWGSNWQGVCLGTNEAGQPIWGSAIGQPTKIRGQILRGARRVAAGNSTTIVLLDAALSGCHSNAGQGSASVRVSGSEWGQVSAWEWTGGSPQVPGALTNVTLGDYGSVGSLCDARCATLDVPSGSTLLVPVDLTQPLAAQDHSIDVGGLATLRGRVWLLASGASVLPADLHVPVVSAGSYDGFFSILQTTVPAPPGKFLTLVPATTAGGPGWALALRDLPSSLTSGTGTAGAVAGAAVAAEAMDFDGDGDDDLAIAIDNGAGNPGALQVLLNDGRGNLGMVSYLRQTQPGPTALAVGELNGDGRTDAVVGTASDLRAQAFLNAFPQTSPPFTAGTQYAVGATPTALTVLDAPSPLVVVGASDPVVRFFMPNAQAAVQATTVPRPTTSIDKRDRLIVSGGANPSTFGGTLLNGLLVVLAPDPATGTYPASQFTGIDVPGVPMKMDVADIDRDGIADVITANAVPQQLASGTALGVLTLFKGTATGFGQPVPIAPQGATAGMDVAMADLNADGVRDIVTVHQTLVGQSAAAVVLVNQDQPGGPLTLGAQQPIEATRPILCPRGQLRGAGAQDEGVFIVESGGGSSFDGEGGGEGNLALPNPAPRAIPLRAQCVGDLDGDGRVSGIDLGALLGAWGTTGAPIGADLNGDGTVSGADLGILVGTWGGCGE